MVKVKVLRGFIFPFLPSRGTHTSLSRQPLKRRFHEDSDPPPMPSLKLKVKFRYRIVALIYRNRTQQKPRQAKITVRKGNRQTGNPRPFS